jgi:hypothetical protein
MEEDLDNVAARLKATPAPASSQYHDGLLAGQHWARETASAAELRRLKEMIEDSQGQNYPWWLNGQGRADPAFFVDAVLYLYSVGNDTTRQEFWKAVLGDDADRVLDGDFLRGFGKGAQEVGDAVKDRL